MRDQNLDEENSELHRLSSSPYVTAVAGSILDNLDRAWLAELIAYYVYVRPRGDAGLGSMLSYAVSRRPRECIAIASSAAPALLAGIIADEDLRSAIFSSLRAWIRGAPPRDRGSQH